MIDSHCHLADEVFAADLDAVIARAKDAGLERALAILAAGDEKEAAQARRVVSLWPECRFAIGVHPHAADVCGSSGERGRRSPRPVAKTPGARAIGEIGLDYHYDYSPRDVQQQVFRAQVGLARELGLPVVIHTREADDDTVRILRETGGGELRGVLHCFTGGPSLARAGLDLGLLHFARRHRHVSRRRRSCGRRRAACRSIACWSRPTARFWRRCRIAASETSRRTWRASRRRWPRCTVFPLKMRAAGRRRTFTPSSGRDKVLN